MKKCLLLLLAGPFLLTPVRAEAPVNRDVRIEKNLKINHLLLSQYARELGSLRRKIRTDKSPVTQKRLAGLQLKIRALKEDAERLQSRLPMTAQADAFLAGFVKRHGEQTMRTGAGSAPSNRSRLHEEALSFVASQNYPEAVKRYEAITLENPNDDEAYLLLGHLYVMMGRYDRAEFAYYNAVHIDRENYNEIIPFYQNLIVQHPNDDEAYRSLGYAYVILGNASLAKDAYEESLRINPGNIESQKGLALLSQKFGI